MWCEFILRYVTLLFERNKNLYSKCQSLAILKRSGFIGTVIFISGNEEEAVVDTPEEKEIVVDETDTNEKSIEEGTPEEEAIQEDPRLVSFVENILMILLHSKYLL